MPQRKKILYVITKSEWGGAQRYVFDLATNLPPDRFDVVVACGPSTSSGQAGPLVKKLEHAGIRVIPIPWLERDVRIGKELLAFWQLVHTFRQEQPDIIHLNSSKVGGLGAIAARLASLVTGHWSRVVFTVHGWGFREDRPWWQRLAIAAASWLGTLFQDRIILIDAADHRVGRRFIPPEKLTLIHHGLGPIDFIARETARRFLAERINRPIEDEVQLIGTIAELTKNKGLTYLIDAIPQAKSKIQDSRFKIQVVVMGEGEERTALERQIERLGLGDTVFLPGFVPEAARYLKALDLFVLPSLKEGLPYALREAMAAGLAIVATRVGGVPDLIEHEKTGLLVPPKDPAALAAAMGALCSRRDLREALGTEARRKISAESGIETMIERTVSLYESV